MQQRFRSPDPPGLPAIRWQWARIAGCLLPVSTGQPEAFVDSVLEFVKAEHVDLVMPVTDWTLGALSAERQQFNLLCHMAMPSQAAFEFVSDKFRTIELAQAIGIGVPKTHLIHDFEDLSASREIGFPVVVKDRFSVRWIHKEAVFGSVLYAYTPDDLASKVRERLKKAGDVLLQEFVSSEGIGFSCLTRGGKTFLPLHGSGYERSTRVVPAVAPADRSSWTMVLSHKGTNSSPASGSRESRW